MHLIARPGRKLLILFMVLRICRVMHNYRVLEDLCVVSYWLHTVLTWIEFSLNLFACETISFSHSTLLLRSSLIPIGLTGSFYSAYSPASDFGFLSFERDDILLRYLPHNWYMLIIALFTFLSLERTLMVPVARYGSSVPQWRAARRPPPLPHRRHPHPAPRRRRERRGGRTIRWSQTYRTSRRRPTG